MEWRLGSARAPRVGIGAPADAASIRRVHRTVPLLCRRVSGGGAGHDTRGRVRYPGLPHLSAYDAGSGAGSESSGSSTGRKTGSSVVPVRSSLPQPMRVPKSALVTARSSTR